MGVGYRRREPAASRDLIVQLEDWLGAALPSAYRNYLEGQDGGRLEDNQEAVKTIFGLGDVPKWASLWKVLDIYQDRVPGWLLPVAEDEYGNLLCVSLRQGDHGAVWFWDHEMEELDESLPPTDDNLTLKAGDWQSFLASLEPLSQDSRG